MGRWFDALRQLAEIPDAEISETRQTATDKTDRTSIVSSVSTHSAHLRKLRFALTDTGFSADIILSGLERWAQPFSAEDLAEIESGELSAAHIRRYLIVWKQSNPERYATLLADASINQTMIKKPSDWYAVLSDLPLNREDEKYIFDRLWMLPQSAKDAALAEYRAQWIASRDSATTAAESTGRCAANTWLRLNFQVADDG